MRAQDVRMVAMVNMEKREVLITGAIDTNGITLNARMKLPDSGVWRVIKAETNLSDEVWNAWQVSFGDGITIHDGGAQSIISRQFEKVEIDNDRNRIVFYGGEVRPGEPILKIFEIELSKGLTYAVISHNRLVESAGIDAENFVFQGETGESPVIDVDLPVVIR